MVQMSKAERKIKDTNSKYNSAMAIAVFKFIFSREFLVFVLFILTIGK